MKLDKETVIVLAICIIVLFGWEPFCRKLGWLTERTEVKTVQKTDSKKVEEKKSDENN